MVEIDTIATDNCYMFSLSLAVVLLCSAAALTGGFIDAIAGGGGLVTMPALLLSGVPPHAALAVNKVSALSGTAVATYVFASHGLIMWKLALFGCLFSIMGTWLGSTLAMHLDAAFLAKVLVILLPVGMGATLLPQKKDSLNIAEPPGGARYYFLLPLVCLLIGAYDGFFGPGTGSFLIIALHWLIRLPLVQASATAKVLNLASNLGSAVVFICYGQVIWPLAFPMIACCVAGNWLGSRLAIHIGARAVRRFLTVSLCLLLLTLIWQYFIN